MWGLICIYAYTRYQLAKALLQRFVSMPNITLCSMRGIEMKVSCFYLTLDYAATYLAYCFLLDVFLFPTKGLFMYLLLDLAPRSDWCIQICQYSVHVLGRNLHIWKSSFHLQAFMGSQSSVISVQFFMNLKAHLFQILCVLVLGCLGIVKLYKGAAVGRQVDVEILNIILFGIYTKERNTCFFYS